MRPGRCNVIRQSPPDADFHFKRKQFGGLTNRSVANGKLLAGKLELAWRDHGPLAVKVRIVRRTVFEDHMPFVCRHVGGREPYRGDDRTYCQNEGSSHRIPLEETNRRRGVKALSVQLL